MIDWYSITTSVIASLVTASAISAVFLLIARRGVDHLFARNLEEFKAAQAVVLARETATLNYDLLARQAYEKRIEELFPRIMETVYRAKNELADAVSRLGGPGGKAKNLRAFNTVAKHHYTALSDLCYGMVLYVDPIVFRFAHEIKNELHLLISMSERARLPKTLSSVDDGLRNGVARISSLYLAIAETLKAQWNLLPTIAGSSRSARLSVPGE